MAAHDVFDEELALRRFAVALRRGDWRLFEQSLERLREQIAHGSPFHRHASWQELLKTAGRHEPLPEALTEALSSAIAELLSVKAHIPSEEVAPPKGETGGIAIVAAWSSSLESSEVRHGFQAWLDPGAPAGLSQGRRLLVEWLSGDNFTLSGLVHRANLTLSATSAGIPVSEPPWVDALMAGLGRVLSGLAQEPPLKRLEEAIALGPLSLLVMEPGPQWERFYGSRGLACARSESEEGAFRLVKLAGSLDWYYCHGCRTLSSEAAFGAIVLACPACGEAAWPMVAPREGSDFLPTPLRPVWAWGARLLREADTWVLVDPPGPSEAGLAEYLSAQLDGSQRVYVIGADEAILSTWQDYLSERPVSAVVTSRAPADEVMAFLLQGNCQVGAQSVPTLKKKRA